MQRIAPRHGAWVVDLTEDCPEPEPLVDAEPECLRCASAPIDEHVGNGVMCAACAEDVRREEAWQHTRSVMLDPRTRRCFRCDPPLPGMPVCPGVEG